MDSRETFASRIGFILVSAGCAIGLGNVWRFPYITGEYGGAAFVIMYLIFLVILGVPIMSMEFTVGRGAQRSIARAYDELEPKGSKWHLLKYVGVGGNYLLMMFYTVVCGWMINYLFKIATGVFEGASVDFCAETFGSMLADPGQLALFMLITCAIGLTICALGLKNGVERITKVMMTALFAIIIILIVRSVTLPGAVEGLKFYLAPDFSKLFASPAIFFEAVYAAMGQSFFTLSIGIGSMMIFGSYLKKDRTLFGEAVTVGVFDTIVALCAGLIIFPACFAFGVSPDSGPGLILITLPNIFEQMWLGRLWGTLFFIFMSFAALSTVVAVFETIICWWMDQFGWTRKKAVLVNALAIPLLSLPCVFGFNLLSGCTIPGIGDIQAVEDFIVSNNLLPLGSLAVVLFCTTKKGWGWKNFLAEANSGTGLKFPSFMYGWMKYGVPILIIVILIMGWLPIVQQWTL